MPVLYIIILALEPARLGLASSFPGTGIIISVYTRRYVYYFPQIPGESSIFYYVTQAYIAYLPHPSVFIHSIFDEYNIQTSPTSMTGESFEVFKTLQFFLVYPFK